MKQIRESDLLPCPFCGGRAYVWRSNHATFVECIHYDTARHRVQFCHGKEQVAFKLWNTRYKDGERGESDDT